MTPIFSDANAPTYLIAEISANHNGSFERALETLRAIKTAGAMPSKFRLTRPIPSL